MEGKYKFVLDLLERATKVFLENSATGKVSDKGGNVRDVVTELDFKLNEFLKKEISEKFSGEKIYSEEDGQLPLEISSFWTVDPIDGSSNFASGIPHFAICVGYIENGVPVLGAAVNPLTKQTFSFLKGSGAFLNGELVKSKENFETKRAVVNFNSGRTHENRDWTYKVHGKLLHEIKSIKYLGSSSLDMCFVGAGVFDANIYGQLSTFDIAFAIAFVREAGGVVVDENWNELKLSYDPVRVMAFGSQSIADEFKKLLM